MKTKIEVSDPKEAQLIKRGLQDPETRCLVKIMGALKPLDDRAKHRALIFIDDYFETDIFK